MDSGKSEPFTVTTYLLECHLLPLSVEVVEVDDGLHVAAAACGQFVIRTRPLVLIQSSKQANHFASGYQYLILCLEQLACSISTPVIDRSKTRR